MSATFTLFEHEYTVGFDWTENDLAAVEKVNRGFGAQLLRPSVRANRRELQAAQYVGVIRIGNRTVQILPKIYRPDALSDQEREKAATHNLLYLLSYAGRLQIHEHEIARLLHQGNDWFEILTHLFASHLLEEWQRGTYRNYQVVEAESPTLKGKWRLTDQLRRPGRKHIFSVSYDEFTADNPLNRVFRCVVERLWGLTRDSQNRRMLGDLRQWMEEVTLKLHMTPSEAGAFVLTRLNQRFEPLLNLARLFLEGSSLQLKADDTSAFAFTFDMNKLFEAFVVNFIRRHRSQILPVSLQSCDLLGQTSGATRHLARHNGRQVFLLKPDLAFRLSGQFPLLMDAKYKRLNSSKSKFGVSEADFYQMNTYAHRYGCDRVILLYPQTAERPESLHERFDVEGTTISITAATVDLQTSLSGKQGRHTLADRLKYILSGEIHDGRRSNLDRTVSV